MNILRPSIWQSIRSSFFLSSCRPAVPGKNFYYESPLVRARGLASSAKEDVEAVDETKPKRKAATQLRRSASASLPIRANPTPTRSEIRPVSVLTTAERYILPQLRGTLPPSTFYFHGSWWIPKWSANGREGEIFVFENGSIVCWGLEESDALVFAKRHIKKAKAEIAILVEPETEDVEFVTDPGEKTRIQGDIIILGETPPPDNPDLAPVNVNDTALPMDTLLARYAFSQALSRSTALSALEVSLDKYLSSVSTLPISLSKTGKPGLKRKELIMKLGQLLKFRQGLNLTHENFVDTPDFYWAEPVLEGYYKTMSDALDVRIRARLLNDKITYAAEVQSVLRELLTESSAHRMELIIIILIAVEVVICLIRDGPELWHMLVHNDNNDLASSKEQDKH